MTAQTITLLLRDENDDPVREHHCAFARGGEAAFDELQDELIELYEIREQEYNVSRTVLLTLENADGVQSGRASAMLCPPEAMDAFNKLSGNLAVLFEDAASTNPTEIPTMSTVPTITIEVSDENGYTIARDRVEFANPDVSAYDAYHTLNGALYDLKHGVHESQLEDTGMLDLDSVSTEQLLAHIDIRRATPTEDLLAELDRRMDATGAPAEETNPNEGLVSMTLVLSDGTWDTFVVNAEVAKEVSDRVMCRDAFDFTDANGETFAFVDNNVVRAEIDPNDAIVDAPDEVPNPFSDEFEVVELELTLKNAEPDEQFPTFEVYRGDANRVFAQLESGDAIIFKDVDDQCHGYLTGTVLSARTDVVSDAPDEGLLAEGTVKVTIEVADDVSDEKAEPTLVAATLLLFNDQVITYTDVSPEQAEIVREQVASGETVDFYYDTDVVVNFVAGSVIGIEIDPTNSFPPNAE